MSFEQECNEYLLQLKTDSVILDGDLVGINEVTRTGRAKVSVLQNDVADEKYIIIYEQNNNINWKFINPKDQIDYDYNPIDGWEFPKYSKRIVAPIQLIMNDVGIKMYGWFQINNLPVYKTNETTVHLYCNVILPEHQAVVNQLNGVITIEDRPF